MNKLLLLCKCFCFVSIGGFFCFASYATYRIKPKLEVTLSNLDRTIIVAGVAATHLEKASGTWEKSSERQSTEVSKAMLNVSVAVSKFSRFISKTDNSINSKLLPSATDAINQQNSALLETQRSLQKNLLSISVATQQAQKVLVDADSQINNPAIKEGIDSLTEAAQNTATFTREGAASMTDVHTALDYELKQLMAPVTKLKLAGNIALSVIRHLYF